MTGRRANLSCGTELDVVPEGIPGSIPVEGCCLGGQASLVPLAQLGGAEIRIGRNP